MSKPHVYVGLSQAPGVYELCFVTDDVEMTFHSSLAEMEMLCQSIMAAVTEQRERDAEYTRLSES